MKININSTKLATNVSLLKWWQCVHVNRMGKEGKGASKPAHGTYFHFVRVYGSESIRGRDRGSVMQSGGQKQRAEGGRVTLVKWRRGKNETRLGIPDVVRSRIHRSRKCRKNISPLSDRSCFSILSTTLLTSGLQNFYVTRADESRSVINPPIFFSYNEIIIITIVIVSWSIILIISSLWSWYNLKINMKLIFSQSLVILYFYVPFPSISPKGFYLISP